MKAWFLKVHRWLALVFALPLAVVILTGLVLSFEPGLVTAAVEPGALGAEKVQALLAQHDPSGQARALFYRPYDGTLGIGGRGGAVTVEVASGDVMSRPSMAAVLIGVSRGLHEELLLEAGWLVIASTAAMLVLVVLGALMGWPRLANTWGGWHKAMAWGLLPLTVLSPLTGLLMAAGVTFAPPAAAPAASGPPLTLVQAVEAVGRDHDLAGLIWVRTMGGRTMARLVEDGEYRVYAVSAAGTTALPRNWPRLWHEGNFAGGWSAAMNVVLSLAMIGLMVTGGWIWMRRQVRRRARRAAERAAA